MPSAVAYSKHIAVHLRIINASVEEQSGVLSQEPVCIDIQSYLVALHDVSVGSVQDVSIIEAILVDTVS